jgi:hypothetical protein
MTGQMMTVPVERATWKVEAYCHAARRKVVHHGAVGPDPQGVDRRCMQTGQAVVLVQTLLEQKRLNRFPHQPLFWAQGDGLLGLMPRAIINRLCGVASRTRENPVQNGLGRMAI